MKKSALSVAMTKDEKKFMRMKTDQTAWMHRLILIFIGCMSEGMFSHIVAHVNFVDTNWKHPTKYLRFLRIDNKEKKNNKW